MQEVLVDSAETDEAVAAMEAFFPGVRLGSARGSEFFFRLHGYRTDSGIGLVDIALGGRDMSTEVAGTAGLTISTALQIDGSMTDAGAAIDDSAPHITRGGLRSEYSLARSRSISIDEAALDAHLLRSSPPRPRGRFRFTEVGPKSSRHASTWRAVENWVETAVSTGLADDPVIGPTLQNTVLAAALACFPNTWSEPEGGPLAAASSAVRRAQAYIDEHAHEPIALSDIAGAARLSERGLQAAFRSQLGVSPMAYLREVRLERAREALRDGDPTANDTVAAIARAAGFVHLSRFAAAYRERFGHHPHDDLRG